MLVTGLEGVPVTLAAAAPGVVAQGADEDGLPAQHHCHALHSPKLVQHVLHHCVISSEGAKGGGGGGALKGRETRESRRESQKDVCSVLTGFLGVKGCSDKLHLAIQQRWSRKS